MYKSSSSSSKVYAIEIGEGKATWNQSLRGTCHNLAAATFCQLFLNPLRNDKLSKVTSDSERRHATSSRDCLG